MHGQNHIKFTCHFVLLNIQNIKKLIKCSEYCWGVHFVIQTILCDQSCVRKLMNFNLSFMHNWIWIKWTQNENCLANFDVKFPSTKVNQNLSTVLVMNMYKRNKLQLCIHFMYSVVTKLDTNNYNPHSQYNCANIFVELTSITVLTIMNITLCVCSETVLLELGLKKSLTPKSRLKGPLLKEWHLIIWRMYCSLCYTIITTLFTHTASKFLLKTLMFVKIIYKVQFLVIH